ncbi:MAG TPA: radical SAM protein, partial [Nitrospiria bacterium]|nr:radical SAM protein [Nitrospiria bacterium]
MSRPLDLPRNKANLQLLPRRIYWEVTRGCNLRCLHCRATPTELASPEDLSTPQCKAIMDRIAVVGHPVLVLTGGEPLFRSDIYELGAYGRSKGFRMGLATNGTLVTPGVARRIVEAGFQKVGISLDGTDAATHDRFRQMPGAFEAAVAGFRALKQAGMPLQVNTSITTHNAQQLEEMLRMVQDLGAAAWHLFLLVPVGCGIQIAESMQVQAEEYERVLNWLYEKSMEVAMDLRAVCAPHYFRVRVQRQLLERQS